MAQLININSTEFRRCNLSAIQSGGTWASLVPDENEIILISTTNALTADGSGECDAYIMGDGQTAASGLELQYTVDMSIVRDGKNAVSSGAIYDAINGQDKNYTDGYLYRDQGIMPSDDDIVSDFVPCVLRDTIVWYNGYAEAKNVYLVYYDQDKLPVYGAYYTANDPSRVPSRTMIVSADSVRYVRATFNKNNPNVYLSVNGVVLWERIEGVDGVAQKIEKCDEEIDSINADLGQWNGVENVPYYQLTPGYVNAFAGNYTETSTTNKKTNLIKVRGYDRIKYLGKRTTQADVVSGCAFYDEGRQFISGVPFYNVRWTDTGAQDYDVEIPENACYFRTTVGNDIADNFYVELIKEETISQITNDIVKNNQSIFPIIGSPSLYFSDATSETATDISSKTSAELYAEYDALVSEYPNYVKRDADRGSVDVGGVSYPMAAYTFGFNKYTLIDHEPTSEEIISSASNLWTPNLNPRKILLVSGMHGEEHTPCWGMMLALSEMLSSNEDWALYLKNNFIFKVIPCLNPYGFSRNQRENSQGHSMNSDSAENDPESIMYMDWVAENKDAFVLFDIHGTQGRYAYFPVLDGLPMSNFCYSLAGKLSALLFENWKNFYNGVSQGYGTTYAPFLVAKTNIYAWTRGRFACKMYEDYGMQMMTIETPDDLVTPDRYHNDLRNCKLTKDMLINVIETFGGLQQLPHEP